MIDLFLALWPLFATIVVGFWMSKRTFPSEGFWPGAERINYYVLFPALLISSLAKAPLNNPALPRLAVAVMLTMTAGWVLLLIARRLRGWSAARFGPFTQGSLRFNTYLGLAAVGSLFGTEGLTLAALMLALMVPTVNILSVWALTAETGMTWGRLLSPIVRNPLIISCVIGILLNLTGIGLPLGSDQLLKLFAGASLPLGLLCVGAALKPDVLKGEVPALVWNCITKLLAMPLLAWVIAWSLGLPGMECALLVLFFGLPTAPTSYVLTRQLGGDGHLMAGIITLQTLLAAGSLVVIMGLFV